jgi:hypothetical protein
MTSSEASATHVRSGTELKFIVDEAKVNALLGKLAATLGPDTYGGGDGTYSVASLYLDTPELASFTRELPGKWRLRRYGSDDVIHVEYKAKPSSGQVVKHRSTVPAADIHMLGSKPKPKWFARDLIANALMPTQLVSYTRRAYMGIVDGIDLRVTLDHDVCGMPVDAFIIPLRVDTATPIVAGRVLEVKFVDAPPTGFLAELAELGLEPLSFSKYRMAMICAGH